MTLEEFLKKNPKFRRLSSIPRLNELYYFLTTDDMAGKMKEITDKRRPALAAVARTLEKEFHDGKSGKNGMNFGGNDQNILLKMFIGSVISGVMRKLGYVKAMNKNLNSGESEYFSAGTLYVKCESLQEQKERADKFWMAYNVGEKVVEIIENWPQISADKFNPHTVRIQRRLKYNAFDIWPLSAVIERYYNSKIFVSTLQLIIELERQHPGITALSELEIFHENCLISGKTYCFSTMIADNLQNFARHKGVILDLASLSFADDKFMSYRFEIESFCDKSSSSGLWRIARVATDGISMMKKVLESSRDEWWSNIFDEFKVLDRVREVLKSDVSRQDGNSGVIYMCLHHLAVELSNIKIQSEHVSFIFLLKELARRIWLGEASGIEIDFMSSRYVDYLSHHYYYLTGLEEYIPIFKYINQ